MQPTGDMLLVELVKDSGVLVTTSGDYGVVKLLKKGIHSFEPLTHDDNIWKSIKEGDNLLVNYVKGYVVEGKTYYFTSLKEVVAVV